MRISVAAIQLPALVDSVEQRLAEIDVQLRAASKHGVRFAVLPELSLTGFEFNPRVFKRAEAVAKLVALRVEGAAIHENQRRVICWIGIQGFSRKSDDVWASGGGTAPGRRRS